MFFKHRGQLLLFFGTSGKSLIIFASFSECSLQMAQKFSWGNTFSRENGIAV